MKVVINRCYGGFGLSDKALSMLGTDFSDRYDIDRSNEKLVSVVEKLGNEANGRLASLHVVELPEETTDWEIDEYDGLERVVYVVDGLLRHGF